MKYSFSLGIRFEASLILLPEIPPSELSHFRLKRLTCKQKCSWKWNTLGNQWSFILQGNQNNTLSPSNQNNYPEIMIISWAQSLLVSCVYRRIRETEQKEKKGYYQSNIQTSLYHLVLAARMPDDCKTYLE